MKKLLAILATLLMVVTMLGVLSGCGSEDNDDKSGAKTSDNGKNDKKEDVELSIEKTVLVDQDGIKVTATEVKEDKIFGKEINMLVENNTDKDVTVSCDDLIINNYMVTNLFVCSVSAGKKSNEGLGISSTELKEENIENIGLIEMTFNVYDSDSYDTIFKTDIVELKTSAYDNMDTLSEKDMGEELYNADGIKIRAKMVKDDIFGDSVRLFVENKMGKDIMIDCDELAVNGFEVTSLMMSNLLDGKTLVYDLNLLESDLEDNGIEKIEEVEMNFSFMEDNLFDTIGETGALTLKVG